MKILESGAFTTDEAGYVYKIMEYRHPLGNYRFTIYETRDGEEYPYEGFADTLDSARQAVDVYRTTPHQHTRQ